MEAVIGRVGRAVWWLACALLAACPAERPADYWVAPPISRPPPAADAGAAAGEPDDGDDTSDVGAGGGVDVALGRALAFDEVPSFVSLFKRLSPSVVNIYTEETVRRRPLEALGADDWREGTSLGSGLVLDREGRILTSAHVVENAASIRVRFHDDEELPARLVGLDPVRDLAVLAVEGAPSLVPVVPGDSDRVAVGEWVVAIGNPLGLSHTMTKGIVSAKGRAEFVNDSVGYLDLIQTDAPIHQGSSGGPLFNMRGRVIGVTTAVHAEGRGIAFAIPWRAVEEALPRLMRGGQVSRSWLGVYIVARGGEGVLVDAVVEESPAARAGLAPGDAIVAIDGREVTDANEFRLRVASAVAGREVVLEVDRGGERLQVTASLEEARDIR